MTYELESTVGDFVTLIRGTTYKGKLVGRPGPALLGLGSINPGGGFRDTDFKTYGGECPEKMMVVSGDLFVALKGATKDGKMIGSVARVPSFVPMGRLTQDTVKLEFRRRDRTTENYLYWMLRTPQYREYCAGRAMGSAVVAMSREDFLSYPVPPITPQRALTVEALEEIEKRIALLRETNVTLEAIAQALFKSWFVDFDPVRAKQEGRVPEGMDEATAALFPDGFEESELGLAPRGWSPIPLGNLCSFQKGCSYKGDGLSEDSGAYMFNLGCFNAPRVYATENIKRYRGEYRDRHVVEMGDLIVANTDMTQQRHILGRPLFVPDGLKPAFVSHHVFKVTSLGERRESLKTFLFFEFLQAAFRERAVGYATGTTVLALPKDALEKHMITLPNEALIAAFHDIVTPLFTAIGSNLKTSDTLTSLRDTLLPRLLSGRLRLPETEALAT